MKNQLSSTISVIFLLMVIQTTSSYAQLKLDSGNYYSQNGKAKLVYSNPDADRKSSSLTFGNTKFSPSIVEYRCIKSYYKKLGIVGDFPSRYWANKTEDGWEVILINHAKLNKLIKFEKQKDSYRNIMVFGTDKDEIKNMTFSDDELMHIVAEFEKEYAIKEKGLIDKDNEIMLQEQEEEINKMKLDPAYSDDPIAEKIVRRDFNNESQELMLWRIAQTKDTEKRDVSEYEIKRVISGNPDSWGGVVNDYGTIVGRHRTVMIIYSYEGKCTWMKGEIRKNAIGSGEFGEPYLHNLTTVGRVPCDEFLKK